ncbi:MAG: transposase [Deltaproteobacteria bacterium 21-66-5]|nr:MAG: transposase [Deltaproteobacteria bacterium 21-66-5]
MFIRRKKSGGHAYLQVVENRWEDGKVRQRVLLTLGREDELRSSGHLDALLASGSRFSEKMFLLSAFQEGRLEASAKRHTGPALVFGRLWAETGCEAVVKQALEGRRFGFGVERALFTTVLHRLCDPGSDRACERWMHDYAIPGAGGLDLQHFYRAMAWLGEPLPDSDQEGATPFSPRCTKDLIEEALFARRRSLFSSLSLCFFDTTSIYFEGEGGESIGQYGHSKDHRPDLRQMVVGAVLDGEGHPVCCEMWPGNTTDVKSLLPVVKRLRERFGITEVCIVSDRGMISDETLRELQAMKPPVRFILGARMRAVKEVGEEVLSRAGRFQVLNGERENSKDPSPLKVKEVWVEKRRYVVCLNEEQARKDAHDRQAILAALEDQLKRGAKSLVGKKGYHRYLKAERGSFAIDAAKVAAEARYDGKWVLRTNTDLPAAEVALQYKQLWMVEALFRSVKSLLQTRPIYHKCDETIRGHVFCSFLALVLRKALQEKIEARGWALEWAHVIHDLDEVEEAELEQDGKRFLLRLDNHGCAGKVFQAAGVAMPATLQQADP